MAKSIIADKSDNKDTVSVITEVADRIYQLANAVTPTGANGCSDDNGIHVESLTEAMVSVSTNIGRVADALAEIARALNNNIDKPYEV